MVGEAANDADEIETILEEAQRLIKQADNRPPFSTPEDSNSALSTLRKARRGSAKLFVVGLAWGDGGFWGCGGCGVACLGDDG